MCEKSCRRCGSKDRVSGRCRPCRDRWRAAYNRSERGKEQTRLDNQRKRVRVEELRQRVAALKGKPCNDCEAERPTGEMHWDHREGTTKLAHVSRLVDTAASWETILSEIEKCDLVCARCHAKRGLKRGQITPYGNGSLS